MIPKPAIVRRWWRGASIAALDLVFPPRCGSCAAEMGDHDGPASLCDRCRSELPLIEWPVCPRCAAQVPTAQGVQLGCGHCRGARLWFTATLALGSYEGLLQRLVMRMKVDRSELVVRTLADLTWQRLGEQLLDLKPDVVTAVPMHWRRRWQRGINPPRILAERLAERLGIQAAGEMLRLKRDVPAQVGLSRPARFLNIHKEMAMRPGFYLATAHVLVVDDILTTGATLSEAARTLLQAGAATVSALVVARTPAEG